jgi:hypothetical protein
VIRACEVGAYERVTEIEIIQSEVPDDSRLSPGVYPAVNERDLGGPEDTIAGPGDGTEGPDAPDEPGPRPPGFPDPDAPEGDEES